MEQASSLAGAQGAGAASAAVSAEGEAALASRESRGTARPACSCAQRPWQRASSTEATPDEPWGPPEWLCHTPLSVLASR
jgi:hypothetical protein